MRNGEFRERASGEVTRPLPPVPTAARSRPFSSPRAEVSPLIGVTEWICNEIQQPGPAAVLVGLQAAWRVIADRNGRSSSRTTVQEKFL